MFGENTHHDQLFRLLEQCKAGILQLSCFVIYRQGIYLKPAMEKSLNWVIRKFDNSERERLAVETWSSLIETPVPLCPKRNPRRRWRGSLALMACPLRHSAVPVACASCWLDSTSPWWEPLPSAHLCLLPIPQSSSDQSCCWWPSPFSGHVACAAACPLPTVHRGLRWAAGAQGWWDMAGWPVGRRLK